MLTKVEVHSSLGAILNLPLFGSQQEPIQIRDIDGIGPVKATINTTPFGSYDGENYTGSSRGNRNVVLILGLNPNWVDQTMSSLRHLIYQYLMPKASVDIHLISDDRPTLKVSGYVESCEPNVFSQDPEIQVSVICPSPDLVAVAPTTATGGTVSPVSVVYDGDISTGFSLRIDAPSGVPSYTGNFAVHNGHPKYTSSQAFQALNVTVSASQAFRMSSVRGKKSAEAVSSTDVVTTVLKKVPPGSIWPELFPGTNPISVATIGGGSGLVWTLTYYKRFGGI